MTVAVFATEQLPETVARASMSGALSDAFASCEESFLTGTESTSGSCALVAVAGGDALVVAHCGDSRAVLCTGPHGEAVQLTDDHKPDSESEHARIMAVGGSVVIGGRCARVTHAGTYTTRLRFVPSAASGASGACRGLEPRGMYLFQSGR